MDRLAAVSHLVYYDQRGRGRSSLGVEPEDVGIESEVDDLDQIRRHLGRSTIALLGHSWGSVLAMEYATRHPEHVSHLILVNIAPASHRGLISFREWRATREGDNLKLLRAIAETPAFEAGDIAAETEYYRVHFGKSLYPPGDLDTLVGSLRTHFTPADVLKARAIEGRLHEQTWRRPEYDLIPRLRELKMPVLVIHGDSELIPLECARNVAEAVPGAKLVVLNGCGHFAYLERPAEVLEAVAALLAG